MPGKFAIPLLIIQASFQLVQPMGGHAALEGSACAMRRPHLHLSMIDEILGRRMAWGPRGEHSTGLARHGGNPAEHDDDVVYLPSEASASACQESIAAIEGVGFAWRAPNQLEIALKLANSLAVDPRLSSADVAIPFLEAIGRWQL